MSPRSHAVDIMTLEVPCAMGMVSWAHGETDNNIHLFFEPFNEADPGHHRPPARTASNYSTSSVDSSDFGSQPQSQLAPTTAHPSYFAEDEYPYTLDSEDDNSTLVTEMDHHRERD